VVPASAPQARNSFLLSRHPYVDTIVRGDAAWQ